jgi:hypothetical protein
MKELVKRVANPGYVVCGNKIPASLSEGGPVMGNRLMHRLFPSTNPDTWSPEQWRRHLLSTASSQSERDDIVAMFRDV